MPRTGSDVGGPAQLAMFLLVAGMMMLVATWRSNGSGLALATATSPRSSTLRFSGPPAGPRGGRRLFSGGGPVAPAAPLALPAPEVVTDWEVDALSPSADRPYDGSLDVDDTDDDPDDEPPSGGPVSGGPRPSTPGPAGGGPAAAIEGGPDGRSESSPSAAPEGGWHGSPTNRVGPVVPPSIPEIDPAEWDATVAANVAPVSRPAAPSTSPVPRPKLPAPFVLPPRPPEPDRFTRLV